MWIFLAIFHFHVKCLWHLKVTQPIMCFWINLVNIYLRQPNIFVILPHWTFISSSVDFVVSPVEDLVLGLTSQNFENLPFSPVHCLIHPRVLRRVCYESADTCTAKTNVWSNSDLWINSSYTKITKTTEWNFILKWHLDQRLKA